MRDREIDRPQCRRQVPPGNTINQFVDPMTTLGLGSPIVAKCTTGDVVLIITLHLFL